MTFLSIFNINTNNIDLYILYGKIWINVYYLFTEKWNEDRFKARTIVRFHDHSFQATGIL